MRITFSEPKWAHELTFIAELLCSCRELGHLVSGTDADGDLHIQWGAEPKRDIPALYCELGWLPRWSYQLSHTGINHQHHRQGERLPTLTDAQRGKVHSLFQDVRRGVGAPRRWGYLDMTALPATSVPRKFVLAPLQMEQDTNMENVPGALRTNEGFINAVTTHVAATLGETPIVFKQHPHTEARPQLGLKTWRKQDEVYAHRTAGIHSLLKHPGCVAVVACNSNSLIESLLWGVPAMAMGGGIWPKDAFLETLNDIDLWPLGAAYRDALAWWLNDVQWTITQAREPERVAEAIRQAPC